MSYLIEPRDRTYIKKYEFLYFAKIMGENLSYKYGQEILDSAKKYTTDAIKTVSKRAIQKTAEATGDLTGNEIADKITRQVFQQKKATKNDDANSEIEKGRANPKDVPEKDTYLQKKEKKLFMN